MIFSVLVFHEKKKTKTGKKSIAGKSKRKKIVMKYGNSYVRFKRERMKLAVKRTH